MRNALSLVGARLVVPVMSSVLVFVLARTLGRDGLGMYATVLALVNLFTSAASFGVRNVLIRGIQRREDLTGDYVVNACVLGVLLGTAAFGVMIAYASIGHPVELFRDVALAGLGMIPYSVAFVVESALIASGRNGSILAATLLQHGFRVAASAGAMLAGMGLRAVLAVFATSNVILAAQYVRVALRKGLVARRVNLRFVREQIVHELGPFSALEIVANVYSKLAVLTLSRFAAAEAVGLFAAANGLYQILAMIPANLALGLFPKLVAAEGERADVSALYRAYLRRTGVLMFPAVVLGWIHAPGITSLLYGSSFEPSATLLRIQLAGIVPFTFSIPLSFVLLGSDRQGAELRFVLINTALALVLFVVLGRRFGETGTAMATALSPLPLLAMQWALLRRELRGVGGRTARWWPLVAWALTACGFATLPVHWILTASAALVAYPPIALASQILDEGDAARLRSFWSRGGTA